MPNANHPENGPFKNTPDEASYTTVPPHNACADDPHTGTYAAADAPSTARPPPTHAYQLPQASPAPKAEETPTEPPQTHAYPLPPPPEKPKLPPGKLFKVLYNYNAMRAFEMSLKVNELILVENPSNEICMAISHIGLRCAMRNFH